MAGAARQPRRCPLLRTVGQMARCAPGFGPADGCFRYWAGKRLVRAAAGPDGVVFGANDVTPRTRPPGAGRTTLSGIYNTSWASVPHRALMPAAASPDFLWSLLALAKFGPTLRPEHFSGCCQLEESVDAASPIRKAAQNQRQKDRTSCKNAPGTGASMGTTGGAWRKGIHVLV
jgi:hypothetical protein